MDGSTGSRPLTVERVLMDTHTLVWALSEPELLSDKARRLLSDSEAVASVASLWELLLKKRKPGALAVEPLPWWEKFVARSGIRVLGIADHMAPPCRYLESNHFSRAFFFF